MYDNYADNTIIQHKGQASSKTTHLVYYYYKDFSSLMSRLLTRSGTFSSCSCCYSTFNFEKYLLKYLSDSSKDFCLSQCLGVSEGNDGIDWRINFLPLLTSGDVPNPLWWGETLLLLGDDDLMPLLGDPPWPNSGISSSWTVSKCLSDLDRATKLPVFPKEEPIEGKDLGRLFFEENGCWTEDLTTWKSPLKQTCRLTSSQIWKILLI